MSLNCADRVAALPDLIGPSFFFTALQTLKSSKATADTEAFPFCFVLFFMFVLCLLLCFQGDPTGQGAGRERTHVPRVHVARRVVPLPLPQRRLRHRHHSGRCDSVREAARQVPEGAEERRERGEELLRCA